MREHLSEKDRRKDRIRGCLLGVAIGDALGAPFEHLPAGETARGLEATGGKVLDFHGSWNGPRGGWTDDTSLTLAACRGFLDAPERGARFLRPCTERCGMRRPIRDFAGPAEPFFSSCTRAAAIGMLGQTGPSCGSPRRPFMPFWPISAGMRPPTWVFSLPA